MSKSAESSDLPVLTVKEQWFWTGFGAVTYPGTMRPSTGVDPASKTGVVESQPINGSVKQCDCVFNYMSTMYTAEIPYDASTCNSNWAMGCSLKRCGLSKLTPSAKPTGEETCMFCVKYERYLVAYGACASHYENDCVSWIYRQCP